MGQLPPEDIFTRRVCLRLNGMEAVSVLRDVPFGAPGHKLSFDAYYPPGHADDARRPAVIIAAGYPGTMQPRPTTLTFKEFGWTVSMCQLIAMSGMVAIAYTNREPVSDLHALLDDLHVSSERLKIDAARFGVVGASGSAPTALTAVMRDTRRTPACAAFLYGCLLDLEDATDVAEAARQFGFADAAAGRSVADLRHDVPLFIARAGRDQFPAMNASIDRFVRHALASNVPITLVNHAEGPHAFDLFDNSRASRDTVRQALRFLRQYLAAEDEDLGI